MLHPAHVAAYILDNRFAKYCTISSSDFESNLIDVATYVLQLSDNKAITAEAASFHLERLDWLGGTSHASWYTDARLALSPLQWWTAVKDKWPILFMLAGILFSLPPSSSAAERLWSSADYIINKRRARLHVNTSNKLISLYWNMRKLDPPKRRPSKPITPQTFTQVHPPLTNSTLVSATTSEEALPEDTIFHDDEDSSSDEEEESVSQEHNDDDIDLTPSAAQAVPVQATRNYVGDVKPFDVSYLKTGQAILVWYNCKNPGWYRARIDEYDEVARRHHIVFDDDTYDIVGFFPRNYGKTWIVI
jgi:hypothetical protein